MAGKLEMYKGTNAVIIAIPRGGVAVGYEMAKLLNLPLDILLSKKIGHPSNKEYAIGSVSLDSSILGERYDIPEDYIHDEIKRIRETLKKKYEMYTGNYIPTDIKNRTVIIVDDGIATGSTLLATIEMLQKSSPEKIVAAIPVLPRSAIAKVKDKTDELYYLLAPQHFVAVGSFYENFEQVTDEEVMEMLKKCRTRQRNIHS